MARTIRGAGMRRVLILLAATAIVVFLAVGLTPGEPAAQTSAPNGKLAYVGFDTETSEQDIYTMNPDGTGRANLTRQYTDPDWSPLGNADGDPEWSPDGTKISFTGTALSDVGSCCSRNVYVMDADGADLQRLTDTPDFFEGEDFQATWAPDGSWLAFTSTRSEGPHDPDNPSSNGSGDREIYRMDADGTNERQLTANHPVNTDEQPSISPDGTKIAFASNRHYRFFGDRENPDLLEIYVMDAADGGNVRRLTFDAAPTWPLDTYSQNPAWSPDGTRIAYESTRGLEGKGEILVMNADGSGEPVNVSNHETWDTDPAWSPDGTQITFTSDRAGQEDIWAVDAPPATPSTPVALLALGADAAWAASEPRNLTPGPGVAASSPDWGTAPPGSGIACTIKGTSGANTIAGTPGDDVICARDGNDTVLGGGGNDVIKGGTGADTLKGQAGGDRVLGGGGSDTLFGGYGDDRVNSRDGTAGNDALDGGPYVSRDTKVADATEKSIVGFP